MGEEGRGREGGRWGEGETEKGGGEDRKKGGKKGMGQCEGDEEGGREREREKEAVVEGRGRRYERVMSYKRACGKGARSSKIHFLSWECTATF